jgi:hypothetical protein
MDPTFTAFDGPRKVAAGPLADMALALKRAQEAGAAGPLLLFDDRTGRSRDVDTRGSDAEVMGRLVARGRPKLGVVPREVTLLPRHWEWLATQPGGASVTLRRLVETALRDPTGADERRQAQERAYHFMVAMAGDLPGFEEATRALFAHEAARFTTLIRPWPRDVRDHAATLAGFLKPVSSSAAR